MSNFAERLVARSTGPAVAAGAPLLTPRPASRFEPSGGPGASSEAALEGAEAATPDSLLAPPDANAPQDRADGRDGGAFAGRADRRRSMPAATSASDPREAVIFQPDRKDRLPTAERDDHARAARPAEAILAASAPVAERAARGSESAVPDDSGKGIEGDGARPGWIDPGRIAPAGPATRDLVAPEGRSVGSEERSEPAISIGRIEVQFLPKEAPAGAPAAQSPRTRGFQAYARARRGQR